MPVYKDDNGTFYYAGKFIDDLTGKSIQYKKRGFKKEREAKQAEREFLLEAKGLIHDKITFKEILKLYISSRQGRSKPRSIFDIEATANKHIIPYFENTDIKKIDVPKLLAWQDNLVKLNLSTGYLDTIQNVFATILNFAVKKDMIPYNPLKKIEKIKNLNKPLEKMGFWTLEEYKIFQSHVDDDNYKLLFDLLYFTGMRIGELQALKWKDFDHVKKILFVHSTYDPKNKAISESTKNGEARYIILNKSLSDALKMRLVKQKKIYDFSMEGFIFGYDEVLSQKTITNNKDRYIKLANENDILNRIRIHDFRHSHVSLLINNGFSSFEIAKRLGHTPSMVEKTYSHMFNQTQKKMADFLETL